MPAQATNTPIAQPPAASTRLSVASCRTRRNRGRAERAANRHLTLARGRAREQQVRDVRAGNHQHESDRDKERQQSAARVLHHVVLERDDADVHVGGLVLGVLGAELARDPVRSACACSNVTPGASRPNTVKNVKLRGGPTA